MDPSQLRSIAKRPSEPLRDALLQAKCFWCERAHPAPAPLSVCPSCVETARAGRFPMGPLRMDGSFPLTDAAIDEILTRVSPGNYALGYLDGDTFLVFYVGRSDSDVRRRLHEWVGAPSTSGRYAPSGRAAWGVGRSGAMPLDRAVSGPVGADADGSYTRFAYSYAHSADAAFAQEWRNYDDFGGSDGLDNATPPSRRQAAQGEYLEQRT